MNTAYIKARLATKLISLLPMTRCNNLKSAILRTAGIDVGRNVQIWSTARFYSNHITIGDNCFIGYGVQFFSSKTGPIYIGSGCDIGTEVIIHTGGHELGPPTKRAGKGYSKPIRVGNGTRISTRSVILEGATVGAGSQVAAGSIVVKDIGDNEMHGGVPAKLIKKLPS